MFDFEETLKLVAQQTVLCVGDIMLDDFVYGDVTRISPEAPTPVLAVRHTSTEIGGAGNVARNIAALGARCIFVALIGNDDAGLALTNALAKLDGNVVPDLAVDPLRQTTRKVRYVSEHHSSHLMRADWETIGPITPQSEAALIAYAEAALPQVGAVVLSDYAKGVLTPRVIRAVIDGARRLGLPVVVDPKGHDYSVYRGATLITPNAKELAAAVHRPVGSEEEIAAAAAELVQSIGCDAVLVTRSEQGMTLQAAGEQPGPCSGLSGQGARRVRRRRHRRCGHDGAVGGENAVRAGDARRQRRGRRRRRQTRHRHCFARRTAPPRPAGGLARARRQDRVRLVGARRAPRGMAAQRAAHRLHQRLLRSSASRPRQTDGRSPRRLRPC